MGDLFTALTGGPVQHADPRVTFWPRAFSSRVATVEDLAAALPLEQKTCVMYGKTLAVPRLECWFSDAGKPYRFGGRTEYPKPWPELARTLRRQVEALTGECFDSCFVNLYRNGQDCIGWHADDDAWIGPVIASLSFGVARRFKMREKDHPSDRPRKIADFALGDDDLLVMWAGVQKAWEHCVPREARVTAARLNFTFRQTVKDGL
jgi:alkylated DNA repair dioxygenase AlkB